MSGMPIITLMAMGFWIWMLVDLLRGEFVSDGEKIVWVLVLIFLNILGAALYFFIGRQRRIIHRRTR